MSVTKSKEKPDNAVRGRSFSFTITFTEDSGGTINNLEVKFDKQNDPVNIDIGSLPSSSVNLTSSGTYFAGWDDFISYVNEDESNLTEKPTIVRLSVDNGEAISDIPPGKNLYFLDQDLTDPVERIYTCNFELISNVGVNYTETLEIIHDVENDLQAVRNFIDNYQYRGIYYASSN